jgi:hypothetical protein
MASNVLNAIVVTISHLRFSSAISEVNRRRQSVMSERRMSMTTTNILNEHVQDCADNPLADSTHLAIDDTDDLEEFPVLLASSDVRDLIEAARKRGISATRLARGLVRDYLRQIRGILLVGNISASRNRSA